MPHSPLHFLTFAVPLARTGSWLLLLCLLSSIAQHRADAAIFACPTADGGTVFQDRPCPIPSPDPRSSQADQPLPLDIHASWFDAPPLAEQTAYCDQKACECGQQMRHHGASLELAVADALYIDGAWHRYYESVNAWQRLAADSGDTRNSEYADLQESACTLMMSQQLLREFASDVALKLRREAGIAEARGFDTAEPCDAGIAGACHYLAVTQLYQRLLGDARALHLPREIVFSDGSLPLDQ